MNPTRRDIDPQLRMGGRLIDLLLRPSLRGFRFANFLLRLPAGRDLRGADSGTVEIDRSDGGGRIRTRVYRPPETRRPLPVVLHLHGGGYALGAPEQDHGLFRRLMATRPCIVVAPDYRLSLEAPYPAALDDAYDALLWVRDNAERLGGRADQIVVMGPSAGGGLTAAVALKARDTGEVAIAFQMPLYPMIDDRRELPSAVDNAMPVWSSDHNRLGWDLYLKGLRERGQAIPAYAAPARAADYRGLPPTATFVGDLDPFRDETARYVANLEAAGVPVRFETFAGAFHGFEALAPGADVSRRAIGFMLEAFAHAVDARTAPQRPE